MTCSHVFYYGDTARESADVDVVILCHACSYRLAILRVDATDIAHGRSLAAARQWDRRTSPSTPSL